MKATKFILPILCLLVITGFLLYRLEVFPQANGNGEEEVVEEFNKAYEENASEKNSDKEAIVLLILDSHLHFDNVPYGSPKIVEETDRILYEIPLKIENNRDEAIHLDYATFKLYGSNLMQNGVDLDAVTSHSENQESTLLSEGLESGDKDEVRLVFNMMKEWDIDINTEMELYHIYIQGEKVEKFRYPIMGSD